MHDYKFQYDDFLLRDLRLRLPPSDLRVLGEAAVGLSEAAVGLSEARGTVLAKE